MGRPWLVDFVKDNPTNLETRLTAGFLRAPKLATIVSATSASNNPPDGRGHGPVEMAVASIRLGAFCFIEKATIGTVRVLTVPIDRSRKN